LFLALERFLLNRDFEGRPAELLQEVSSHAEVWNDRYFPSNPAQLSTKLRRMRPALAKAGIIIELPQRTREGRHIRARMTDEAKATAKSAGLSRSGKPAY
jgi:hypothetical protein